MHKEFRTRVKELRSRLSAHPDRPISQQRLSQMLGVSISTVARWERGGTPEIRFRHKLNRLTKILNEIGDVIYPEDRLEFFEKENPTLLGMRPIDLLDTNDGSHAVITRVRGIQSGGFS